MRGVAGRQPFLVEHYADFPFECADFMQEPVACEMRLDLPVSASPPAPAAQSYVRRFLLALLLTWLIEIPSCSFWRVTSLKSAMFSLAHPGQRIARLSPDPALSVVPAAFHPDHSFRDLLWRSAGLPGRGLALPLATRPELSEGVVAVLHR